MDINDVKVDQNTIYTTRGSDGFYVVEEMDIEKGESIVTLTKVAVGEQRRTAFTSNLSPTGKTLDDLKNILGSVKSPIHKPILHVVTAPGILKQGCDALSDRAASRDTENERSMTACVAAFNAMYGKGLTVEQGWMFQVFLKASRAKGGSFREDDYVDGASYFALAGEEAQSERG